MLPNEGKRAENLWSTRDLPTEDQDGIRRLGGRADLHVDN